MSDRKEIKENKGAVSVVREGSKKTTAIVVVAIIIAVVLAVFLLMISISSKGYESAFPSSGLTEEVGTPINPDLAGLKAILLFGGNFYAPTDAEEVSAGHIVYKTENVRHVVCPVNKVRSETICMAAKTLSNEEGFAYEEARVENGYHGDKGYLYSAGICSNGAVTYYALSYSYRTASDNMILFISLTEDLPNDAVRDDALLTLERYIDENALGGTEGQNGDGDTLPDWMRGGDTSSGGAGSASSSQRSDVAGTNNAVDGNEVKYNAQRYIDSIKTTVGQLDENGKNDLVAEYRVSYDMSKETQHFYMKYSNAKAVPSYAFIRSPSGKEYDADALNVNKLGEIYFVIDKPEKGLWRAFFGPADYGTYTCGVITQDQYIRANDPNNEQYPKE